MRPSWHSVALTALRRKTPSMPRNAVRIVAGSSRSPATAFAPGGRGFFGSRVSTETSTPRARRSRATCEPTVPVPPRTRTFIFSSSLAHVPDDRVSEAAALYFRGAFHLAREVVGDRLGGDRPVHALEDEVGGFVPAHVPQHHLAREDFGSRVDLVEIRVLRRRAVCRFEDGMAGHVVDVSARRDPDAAHLRGEGIRKIVAVEIHRRDDVELVRTREHLLERDVGDRVLDEDLPASERRLLLGVRRGLALLFLRPLPLVPGVRLGGELALGEGVAVVPEGAFRELHDVALVDERDALALVRDRVLDRGANETLAAPLRDGLHTEAGRLGETELLVLRREVLLQERGDLPALVGSGGELDSRVDVLGILPEDDHVHLFGVLDGRRHALEPAHGAQADVEVESLAQRDVERTDAAADRRRERSLDADEELAKRVDRLVWKPRLQAVEGFLARVDLHPFDLAFPAVSLFDGGVEDAHGRAPDVRPGSVTLDEGNDGVVGDLEPPAGNGDLLSRGGHRGLGAGHEETSFVGANHRRTDGARSPSDASAPDDRGPPRNHALKGPKERTSTW